MFLATNVCFNVHFSIYTHTFSDWSISSLCALLLSLSFAEALSLLSIRFFRNIFFFNFQAVRYIELLPPEKRPVAGTEGAVYRRQQMARQLPEHDQDPSRCHELTPAEVKQMLQYIRKYKDEALGVGDVMLPEDIALVQAGGKVGPGVRVGAAPGTGSDTTGAAVGAHSGAGASGIRPGDGGAGVGAAVGAGLGPITGSGRNGMGPGSAGPLSGPGVGPSPGLGPARGAVGTTATAGALGMPGAQQAGPPQQTFVSSLSLFSV